MSINDRTVEHVPARVFLDRPFPENLATVYACRACNNGTSADELYVACLLEVMLAGTIDCAVLKRRRIAQALERHPELTTSLQQALEGTSSARHAKQVAQSLTTVATKIARGHLMFDLADPRYDAPQSVRWFRMDEVSTAEAEAFDQWSNWVSATPRLLPEVGSRALRDVADLFDEPRTLYYGDGGVQVMVDPATIEMVRLQDWLRARATRLSSGGEFDADSTPL